MFYNPDYFVTLLNRLKLSKLLCTARSVSTRRDATLSLQLSYDGQLLPIDSFETKDSTFPQPDSKQVKRLLELSTACLASTAHLWPF